MNGHLLESRAIDSLDNDSVVRAMQVIDIIIDDHAGGILPCCLHAKVGLLLLQNELRPKNHRHSRRVGKA